MPAPQGRAQPGPGRTANRCSRPVQRGVFTEYSYIRDYSVMGESRRIIRYVATAAVVGAALAAATAASGAAAGSATPEAPQTLALRYSFDRSASGPAAGDPAAAGSIDESGHAHALTTL